ncbi:DUF433 domain-containing protein [Kribbella sp. NPDC004536]|uniref:DUF433 domain-containing protein n=1 Tax=Kribbella sp. NPDC004536 TaxID=3364106 RepID=UPI003674E32E
MSLETSGKLEVVTNVPTMLDRELYSVPEAARLLGLSSSTLHYWLEGGERRGVRYEPIIRPEPVGRRSLTWAEFIEAGWLSTYRRRRQIPMSQLRAFISVLRAELGIPYPLAHSKSWVSGRTLVLQAQEAVSLAPEFQVVSRVGTQLMLTYAGETFMERVVWDGDVAAGWKPHTSESPVEVRPGVRFGRPAVAGISTAGLFDEAEEGASAEEIADDFSLSVAEVRWALSYEEQRRAAA